MPLRGHLPVCDMEPIIGMLLARQTQRHVGRPFNVSHTVVGHVWQRYLDTGSVVGWAGRGLQGKQRTMMTVILSTWLNIGCSNPLKC